MRGTLRTMIPSTTVVWCFLTGVAGIPASVWLAAVGTAVWAAQGAPGAAGYTEDFSVT